MSPAERLEDCKWSVRVTSVWTDGWVGVEWGDHEACPPEAEGWVFWASYAMVQDGSGLLFDWFEYRLSDSNRHVDFLIHTPPSCETWFVVRGNVALKSTLSAAQMQGDSDPYGGNSLHYDIDKDCQPD